MCFIASGDKTGPFKDVGYGQLSSVTMHKLFLPAINTRNKTIHGTENNRHDNLNTAVL